MLDKLLTLDTQLFLWLNSHHSPVWDKIMWFISGKEEWAPLYLIIVGYIIYKYRWKSIYVFVAVAIFVTLADQISTNVFKDGFKRLRPSHTEELKSLVHLFTKKNGEVYYGGLYGFVSSHAANSFALASFISRLFKIKWFTWLIYCWAALVSYSRIYLGVHYPGDIIGGAILGILIGWFVFWLYTIAIEKVNKSEKSGRQKTENS